MDTTTRDDGTFILTERRWREIFGQKADSRGNPEPQGGSPRWQLPRI